MCLLTMGCDQLISLNLDNVILSLVTGTTVSNLVLHFFEWNVT